MKAKAKWKGSIVLWGSTNPNEDSYLSLPENIMKAEGVVQAQWAQIKGEIEEQRSFVNNLRAPSGADGLEFDPEAPWNEAAVNSVVSQAFSDNEDPQVAGDKARFEIVHRAFSFRNDAVAKLGRSDHPLVKEIDTWVSGLAKEEGINLDKIE